MGNVAVIGGGAAGMLAALTAAEAGASVTLLERQARVGKKLSVTGNGRCNLTNANAASEHYHGEAPEFVRPALAAYPAEAVLRRFGELGLLTVTEPEGRVYPLSDTAGSVVDVLRFALDAAGITLRLGTEVTLLRKTGSCFSLHWNAGVETADRVIVCCGGAAGEKAGGSSLGYRLLEQLGHRCTPLRPGLVQLRAEGTLCRSLKGIRADAGVTVLRQGKPQAHTRGEVQFADYGLTGPAIFEVSRCAREPGDTTVSLDLLQDYPEAQITALLRTRRDTRPELTMDDLFTGMLHNRLGRVILKAAGYSGSAAAADLQETDLRALSHAAKHFAFRITGDLGMSGAQVTVGGIRTGEFDPNTLESRLCPGLYACGEVLDIDGDCGGYNLQWAWASGLLAGRCAGEE